MPRFRYEAIDSSGVPIHGTTDADSESALAETLATRSLRLLSAAELSLDSLVGENTKTLPRLQQLRIGEQIREALLTGLPAHEAVRAIAAEPLSHPILGVAPWLQVMATITFAVSLFARLGFGIFHDVAVITGIFAFVFVPLLWLTLRYVYHTRPKSILRRLASMLEAGQAVPASLDFAVPSELRHVMSSDISDGEKARVAADLVPSLVGSNFRAQQFVMTLVGPLLLFSMVLLGVHSMLLLIVPKFGRIFEDFGTQLPWLTEQIIFMSKTAEYMGATGWLMVAIGLAAGLIVLATGLSSGWASQLLERVPIFGVAFRWAMQARVARILAAMIRNDCNYAESLRAATAGSGFQSVREHGQRLAKVVCAAWFLRR